MKEDTDEIDRLLAAGANISSKNQAGITAIQLAKDRGKKKALAHFRSKGLG
jgi:ankyrin repeat protein